jgi:putative DNA primase/helicase
MPDTNCYPHIEPPPGTTTSDDGGFYEETPSNKGNGHGNGAVAWPPGYSCDRSGVWFQPQPKKPDDPPPDPVWICAPLTITAETNDDTHHGFGLLLSWVDRAGQPHTWAMPIRMVHAASGGGAIAAELADAGLTCAANRQAQEHLRMLLGMVRIKHRVRCVESAGWHGSVYVLPDGRTFGSGADTVVMQSEHTAPGRAYSSRGTLAGWQSEIALYAPGNDLLVTAVAAAFAGPILDVVGDPSGGLHIHGHSQSGKTTLLRCAASVYGPGDTSGPMRTWRVTANGLEAVAAETSDGLLVLDEMGQASAREIGDTIYMLSNQAGKARANRTGGARRHRTWRVLFLSSGEIPLAAKMGEAGRTVHAGQDVRLIGIPADAGVGFGVWQNLHGKTSAALSDHLRVASRSYFGTAGPAFLEKLAKDRSDDPDLLFSTLRQLQEGFLSQVLPQGADGQVRSVAARFGLIAAAGEMATAYEITGWRLGTATRAASACFNRWISTRGHSGAAEDMQAVQAVQGFIGSYGAGRFEDLGDTEQRPVNNRAGWKRRMGDGEWEYLILASVWKNEVCKGLNPAQVAKVLSAKGLLLRSQAGPHFADKVAIPGHDKPRLYRISGRILTGGEPE